MKYRVFRDGVEVGQIAHTTRDQWYLRMGGASYLCKTYDDCLRVIGNPKSLDVRVAA